MSRHGWEANGVHAMQTERPVVSDGREVGCNDLRVPSLWQRCKLVAEGGGRGGEHQVCEMGRKCLQCLNNACRVFRDETAANKTSTSSQVYSSDM